MLVNVRVLGRVRLSRTTDESTSVERQQQIITQWAEGNNHTIVGWAIDVDVSGSINPFDTPSLGPWLKMPKAREWDILCAWKLDRVARNSIGLHKVFAWIQENDKQLVCIADNIGKQKLLQKAGIIIKATSINSNTEPKPGIFHTELIIPPRPEAASRQIKNTPSQTTGGTLLSTGP